MSKFGANKLKRQRNTEGTPEKTCGSVLSNMDKMSMGCNKLKFAFLLGSQNYQVKPHLLGLQCRSEITFLVSSVAVIAMFGISNSR